MSGNACTDEAREKIRAALKGRPKSPETIARMRAAKRPPITAETREKMRLARIGVPRKEETKQRIGATMRVLNQSPAMRAKRSAAYANASGRPTKPELALINALDKRCFKHVGQQKASSLGLPISADIMCYYAGMLIMVDGCHWHECPLHGYGKYLDRPARDARIQAQAEAAGWTVLRFWEHEIYQDLSSVVEKINATRARLLQSN